MEKLNQLTQLFNRIYFFLFKERFNQKLDLEFPKNIYRWNLIQHIINKKLFRDWQVHKDQSFSKI
jgi:hypothetical protein